MADNMNGSSEDQSVATEPPTPAQEVPACSVMSQEPDCSILEESADVSTPPPEEESPSPSPTPESEPRENGSTAVDKKKDKKKTKKGYRWGIEAALQNTAPDGKQGGAEGSAADAKEIEQTIKQTMQTLNAMDNPDEKLGAIVKRYAELLGDHRSLQREFKAGQRMQAQVMREKEKLQAEHSKALLARSKLESLCRELQRHNKAIKEESQRKMKEEEEKRREISSKFQVLLKDINEQMNISREKSSLLRKENVDLMKSMKELISKYEEREEHVEKLIKQKDLERQLAEAKMQQATMMLAEEKEKFLTEKQVLLKENYAHRERAEQMAIQEENMKMQLKLYTEKFEELHKTLNQSNEVFNKFKVEMDTMNKRMKKLEKESFQWRTKWEKSNVTLIAMAEEKQTRDKELIMLRTKCGKLENLCRALQNARSDTESGADKVSEVLTKFEEAEQTLAAEIRANKSSSTATTTDIPVPDPTSTDGATAGTAGGDESADIGEPDAGPGSELSAAAGGGDTDDVDDFIALIRADTTRLEDMPKPPPEELSLLDILNMKDPIRGEPSLEGAEKEKEKEGGEVEKGVEEDDVDTVPSKLEAID
ncbi:alpha-taxilin-like isoform X2 [Branchiostoma floridae]|uniref:Alpha-taxilin-like isoform X2 n=1 Tax=Branchiostoma floridae TaxID=7739 RepID=A0A9J7HRH4_BRAFL|nr:alpha-taxilin-like isoform X2 [Branchiostoma floridae]